MLSISFISLQFYFCQAERILDRANPVAAYGDAEYSEYGGL